MLLNGKINLDLLIQDKIVMSQKNRKNYHIFSKLIRKKTKETKTTSTWKNPSFSPKVLWMTLKITFMPKVLSRVESTTQISYRAPK
jgi:hypothetical protein